MTIADRIKLRREELGMSQDELATKIGTKGRSGISRIENSGDDVTMKNVIRIATALSTTPRYLMGYEDAPEETTQYTTLNQIYHVLKRDPLFDDRAIPVVFGYDSENEMREQIKQFGPILIPYSRVKEVANIYDLSPDYLMGKTSERRANTAPPEFLLEDDEEETGNQINELATVKNPNLEDELELIKAYRKASDEIKDAVKKILDIYDVNEENVIVEKTISKKKKK